ncbi:MAG: hypothetical protein U0894_17140 [Pirellulales bacterium]
MTKHIVWLALAIWAFASVESLQAENVDLSMSHSRLCGLTIYNGEDLTLVRDRRTVTFKKGVNPLQFSWAGTRIDPTSVNLRFATHADKLEVLETTFPHGKPSMLYWNVSSEHEGEVELEISYFTSGISWTADYIGISDAAEKKLDLEGYVRVQNNSGEEYEMLVSDWLLGRSISLKRWHSWLACQSTK